MGKEDPPNSGLASEIGGRTGGAPIGGPPCLVGLGSEYEHLVPSLVHIGLKFYFTMQKYSPSTAGASRQALITALLPSHALLTHSGCSFHFGHFVLIAE